MKKTVSVLLLVVFVFSACLPLFAQKTRSIIIPNNNPEPLPIDKDDFAQFQRVYALSDGQGVLVRWEMTSETRNVGFFVYRMGIKGLEQVNQIMVLGSAAKSQRETLYGEQYELYDPAGNLGSSYVIQSVAEDGRRGSTDAVATKYSNNIESIAGQSKELLESRATSQNGRIENTYLPQVEGGSQTNELKIATTEALSPSDPVKHAWVVYQSGAKIAVRKDGMYRVMRAELQGAGFDLNNPSTNWRLYMQGVEQAILIGPGDQYIDFYGKAVDTVESDTRMYYLIYDTVTAAPAKRILTKVMRPVAGNVISNSYMVASERRERTSYLNSIQNGDAENYWGRAVLPSTPTTYPFNLTGVDYSVTDTVITLKLQGWIGNLHSVKLVLNGHDIGFVNGQGVANFSGTFHVPTSFLTEGSNSLDMTSMNSGTYSLFDTLTVQYARKYQAEENRVVFFTPGYRKEDLGGFTSPLVSTVTISDSAVPATVSELQNVPTSSTPGILRMGATKFNGGEFATVGGPGFARITVYRMFGNTGNVTADLTLTNGTAAGGAACGPGIDYIFPISPTITFPNGVNSKSIDVGLCPDGVTDPGETFTATLSNVTGGASLAQINISVFDTTFEGTPQLITNLPVVQNDLSYSVKLPSHRAAVMYGVDESYLLQSPAVTANNGSNLASTIYDANLLIISHSAPDFMAAAQAWAAYRRTPAGGGFTVKVIDVADIFDEYNYGVSSAASINSFLYYAKSNWQTQYVLLLGDASFDPRNYQSYGYWDIVPTKIVRLIYEESGSDEALADFNNDGRAELAIGRIPVRTGAAVTTAFNKTTTFEATGQSLGRGAVFASDNFVGYNFEDMSLTLRNKLPPAPAMPATMIVRGPSNEGHAPLMTAINSGPYIVNYSGHGATGLWASSGFFYLNDVPQLTNSSSQSIFTMLTCFNGVFINPAADSIAESLLKAPNGGAVATWASTTETTPDIQMPMALDFYDHIAIGDIPRIGDLIAHAKTMIASGSDVGYSWALLGDPTLQVRPTTPGSIPEQQPKRQMPNKKSFAKPRPMKKSVQ